MSRFLFEAACFVKRPEILRAYKEAVDHLTWSRERLAEYQVRLLREYLIYCSENIEYYTKLFREIGFDPTAVRDASDLAALPLLTKDLIRANPDQFFPKQARAFTSGSTGGSTGQPLKYRMSFGDSAWSMALLLRGWGYAGYKPGDRMAVVAGASLTSKSPSMGQVVKDYMMNIDHYSSYGMDEDDMMGYLGKIEKSDTLFLRGYATALYRLALVSKERGKRLRQLRAVFSTAEVLSLPQRAVIEDEFGVKVYDNYGLNDGGVSAFECEDGNGMHIDYERGVLEVVDDNNLPIKDGVGKILATSIRNRAMAFVRYDTGDMGEISSEVCSCGLKSFILKRVLGRTTQELILNGKSVGSPVFTVLMGKTKVNQYRIRQVGPSDLNIEISSDSKIGTDDKVFIARSLEEHLGKLNVKFSHVDFASEINNNKHQFIIKDF